MILYFIFGMGQPHANGYVIIHAAVIAYQQEIELEASLTAIIGPTGTAARAGEAL